MRVVHCKREPFTVYIGRPHRSIPQEQWGPFGNPIFMKREEDRQDVLERFEIHARQNCELLDAIEKLSIKDVLGCWCAPRPCHGDIIIKLWRLLHE